MSQFKPYWEDLTADYVFIEKFVYRYEIMN